MAVCSTPRCGPSLIGGAPVARLLGADNGGVRLSTGQRPGYIGTMVLLATREDALRQTWGRSVAKAR